MPNPKDLRELHRQLVSDGIIDMGYKQFESIATAKGKEGVQNRQDLYNIAKEGGYHTGSYKDFANAYFVPVTPQKKEQMKQQARQATGRQAPAKPQKPAATPQGQKPKPVQQPKATPNKPDSVVQQYMPTVDPTASNGKISRVRPQQGTGVLKTDAQIMADDTLSAEDKATLINDNRRRKGQRQRTFNGPAYEETAMDAGLTDVAPVGFTDQWEFQHETANTPVPNEVDNNGDGVIDEFNMNYVNKTPYMLEQDRIKEIADEINYYNTKQDQGGGGTTRIEDAINAAYEQFVRADDSRDMSVGRLLAQNESAGIAQEAIERGSLREKYAGIDAVVEAAYNSFPNEIKQKYGEDVVRDAIYQATLSAMQENARPENFGEYLGQKLSSMVPGILYKAAVRANAGGKTTLSDISDMGAAQYEEDLEGLGGTVQKIAGEVLPMAFDPTMYIPIGGAAGNAVGRGVKAVAAKRAAARGLESGATKLAGQAATQTFVGRGAVGAASTAAQMAAYEEALGLASMANGSGQNFWEVTGEALESGLKMAPIGFIAPAARVIKGRTATAIANKGLSRGGQWAANTAAKLGISTGAFMAEAGVFAAPDIIGMAYNGTYTNEQAKDIALHSIATLAGFKVAGVFNPAHIGQTARQFESIVKGTMGTELALDRHDSEALERLGYPKIQGDNIMSLFVPLGERPEAKEGGGYFSYYSQIVLDERVPWSTRAKLIYVATGMLPETGVRPNRVTISTDENGRTVVTTLQGNNPISQRFFSNKHKASAESYYRKTFHDVERMQYEGVKQDIISENTGGMGRSRLLNDVLAKKPSERTSAEMSLIDAYEASVNDANEIVEMAKDIAMQGNGVDPEKALKKSQWERNDAERQSVERYYRYLNRYLDELRRYNYEPIAREMAQRTADDVVEEMSNTDGKVYRCQLRDEGGTWYTIVDFDGTIERGETGMDVQPGTNGDKMMVRNMATGETKMATIGELSQISLDVRDEMHAMLEDNMLANYLNTFVANSRRASMYGKQPQNAEEGERLTLAADDVDPTTGLRPEYVVINKDGKSGTYIVEDEQGNRKLINGHDILQKITDTEQQIPTQINPQVPPTGPQTPPPAAPAQEPPVQPQGEAPAMPEQGEVFKLKVGDEFKDAEVIGKDDTGIIVRYEDNGGYKTEHLTPEELAPRLEQQEAPAAPVTPPAPEQGEGGAPAAPENGIPEDENGNKLFHKAEPKAVEDYFKNEKGYDDRFIAAIADKRIAEAQKDLADAGAKREKAYADVDEQAMDEAIAAERDAQERLDWWNKFKEGYGKEEPAGEQPPVVEGGSQPPVQEPDIPQGTPRNTNIPNAPIPEKVPDATTPEEKAAQAAANAKRYNDAEKLEGYRVQITLPSGRKVIARYKVVPHNVLVPSHDPFNNYRSTPGYAEDAEGKNVNDRDYSDPNYQMENQKKAGKYGGQAITDVPVVNTGDKFGGSVLGGNDRTMAGQLAATRGTDSEYLDALDYNIAQYGISRRALRDYMNSVDGHARLVLEVEGEMPMTTETMALFNQSGMKASGGKQAANKTRRLLEEPEIRALADVIGKNSDRTFGELARSKEVAAGILRVLKEAGIILENEQAEFLRENGVLSKRGEALLQEIVRASILDESGIQALYTASEDYNLYDIEQRIDQITPALLRNAALGKYGLRNEISRAIGIINEAYAKWASEKKRGFGGTKKDFLTDWVNGKVLKLDFAEGDEKAASEQTANILSLVFGTFSKEHALAFFNEYETKIKELGLAIDENGHMVERGKLFADVNNTRAEKLRFLAKKYADKYGLNTTEDNGPEQPEQGEGQPGETETPGGNGGGNQGNGGQSERGQGEGSGEGPVTPPRPSAPGAPQGGGEPPKGEGEPPKPEEPGKPAGEPAGGPATPPSGERHQLTVDEINGLNLSQSTKENAIDYVNGDRGPRATNAYETALKEWERVNGKSGEGKTEAPPAAPEDNGPQEPPKGGGGTSGRGGVRTSPPKSGRGKPAEPKPDKPKPEGEEPKDSGGLDFSGLDELGEFEGLFGDSDVNESRRPAREDGRVSDTNEARYIPNKATAEQNRAVEKVVEVLAGIGKQLLEKRGMRTQSELVDFMRRNDEAKKIREALDKIGFDDEDKSNLFDDMWGQRVDTPWEAPRNRMRLSEYADELSKIDKPKQDDKPKQIVSPMEPTVKNIVYHPNSKGKTNESIIPASMAQAVKTALSKINDGDTDGFVMNKVGFKDKDELYEALNAEQIDGVALAISAIERGEGLILGDMTGIGKGRQLAAVIRYARKEGMRPVFVTEKPGLFKDMMRDLLDVGADTPFKPFRPLILASDSDADVIAADGSKVKRADAQTIEKLLSGDLDKLAKGYDALFVTYANINNAKPETFFDDQNVEMDEPSHDANTDTREPSELTKKKLNLVAKWARGSIVVMDEAHNAAGVKSTQGVQWREIIDTTSGVNAKGVVMASATYAKTPKNYVLYSLRTPIKEAHLSSKKLEEVFAKGGVPLQEWLAGQLTGKSYIRRERDMTGVNFDYRICVDGYDVEHPENSTPEALEKVKAIRESNDKAARIANTLLKLDNVAKTKIQEIRNCLCPSERSGMSPTPVRVLVKQGDGTYKEQTIDPKNYPNRLKVKSSSFSSRISQINAQLFMAEKAESAADAAIKAINEGELPMIVFENTFDSLMKDLPVDGNGVIESDDYSQAFVRYLEGLGNFTVDLMQQNPTTGAWEELKCRIDLSRDKDAGLDFVMAKNMIENEGVGLHVSPVDRIRERLEEAGYKVGELSGRKWSIQKLPDGKYHRVKRKTENPDKVTDDYNTGKIDVLMINASGSTGRSMHEKGTWSEDGQEKIPGTTQSGEPMMMKPRHQIYVQNFNNETTMVQAMGRIDRTGQVEHGRYTFLMTPVPAETNILMRAQRKREQLKANTTAQQDRNSFDAVNASDFINKYGDEVVAEYLTANPEIRDAMRINENDVTENGKPKEGIAKKATMNAYTLTCEQQQEFYDKVQAEYDEYVKVLKENGDYDLETQVVDLQAETLAEHMFVRGSHESDSMFSQDTNIARCRVKIQKKPLKLDEIYKHISERTGTDDQYEWNAKLREQFEKHFADMEAEVEKEYKDKTDPVELAKKLTKQSKIAAFKAAVDSELKRFQLDLLIPFFYDTDEVTQAQGTIDGKERPHAIVYDIKLGRTLGSSSIIFAVNDGRQKVAVRMNDARTLDYIMMLAKNHTEKFDRNEWNKAQADAYEDAYIITGNLIGAYHNDIAMRGRMIRYTDSEGNLHTGILMPRNFKTSDITVQRPISEMFNTLMSYANEPRRTSNSALPKFANGNLEIEDTRHFDELRFIVKGNKEGELAFNLKDDPDLKTYRTSKNPLKFTVRGQNSIRKVLGILAGRYGVSASVAVDPAYFMTREERDEEAEARMFRVNENIEETTPSRGSLNYGMPYTVHVIKERRKNIDPNSDWFIDTISKLKSKGLDGAANYRRGLEGSKRVYDEFFFENKKMAEEFVRMVNDEPARPLSVDERVDAKEPEWEDVDRSQHTYQLSDSSYLTGEDIATTFGFRNVDTGHFRSDEVRDLYNAFMTMAMILNIHPKSISLGGNMDVQMLSAEAANKEFKDDGTTAQFQTSGKANSYTGATQKKMQFRDWATSFPIAHEWLHALDNYFGTFGLKNEETGYYEQTRKASESADRPNRPWTARPEMRDAWVGLLRSLVDSGFFGRLENENFFKNTSFTDSKMRPKYWGKRTEMLARAFEPYLRKKITDSKDNLSLWASLYGESEDLSQRMRDMITQGNDNLHGEFDPTPKEQAVIDKAFDKFFETVREKRDPDTGRVIMYEQARQGETRRESTMRETRNLNRVLAKTGLANSVTIDSERDFAEGVFASTGRPMRTLDGIIYGYTDNDGNIHLNAKYLNFETPIHEYGHLWTAWAKKNHGDLWQRGIELAKESDAFKKLKEESKKKGSVYNGMTDDQLADEVLADAIGKKGQDMYDPKDWTRTARVRHWLTQLWHRIGEALGFRKRMKDMAVGDMSFDDIIRTAAGDILSGKRMKGTDPDDRGPKGRRFSSKGSVPTFYSNAARAVENVKQNKATAEQWKAMLTKQGGIKAGEDKWMGLSTWLDEHKGETLTKDEVAQFVADNGIEMEEVNYSENIKPASIEVIPETVDTKYTGYAEYAFPDYPEYTLKTRYEYPYGDVYDLYRNGERIAKSLDGKYKAVPIVEENARNESGTYPINEMRDRHTTNGLSNKREIVFTVPDVGPYEKDDFVHFGPENKGHQIMWVRFGETTDTEGNRVLVIDEVQSNRHQAARKVIGEDENGKPIRRGYKETYPKAEIDKQRNHINSIIDEINRRNEGKMEVNVRELGMAHDEGLVTDKEYKLLSDEIKKFGEMIRSNNAPGIPAAPFESNWHEVAMKRMLRLAAEEGFDKVAWTTGKQQNDRYNLATYISKIEKERRNASTLTVDLTVRDTNGLISFDVDKDGIITHTYQNKYSETVGKPLADVIGKEVADEVLHSRKRTFNMDEMEIGGEGMKGFYDDMLPRFMDKYGKKWGVKVGEVELNTPGKEVMHSVDITPEMRESVITQGQPLFQARSNEQIDRYPNGEIKEVRNYDGDGNLTRLMRYDENRHLVRHYQTDIDTDWTSDENGVARGMSNGVELKPYNFRFQQDLDAAGRDREYADAVEKKDDAAAQKLVDDAAKAAGMATDENGKLIDLYHGTGRFGFTIFDRLKSRMGAFFTSTRRNVAANYAGDDHYAGVRKINKGYKQDDSQEVILNNARSVFDQDWKMATEEQKQAIVTKVEADARKVTDEIEKRQVEVETLPADEELDIFNATAWVMDLFYTVAYAKENGNDGEDLYRLVADGVERYNENKQVIRDYVSKHYDELDEKQKNYLNYLTGWDSGDVAIDIECSYMRVVSGKDLATVTGNSMLTLDELKKNTDETHNIGSYHLYGNLGDNPLVVDAEGKNWYSLEYDGRRFDTDTLAKFAKENGYTALVVKNVYDYGDKADDYIFFEPSQLKSADPATYDDNGKLIPLSQRFDRSNNDLRFQQAPANNPAGSQQGNNEQLHIAREYAQDRTRNTTKFMEEVVENSISLRHVLEDIARKSGKPIADYENVYLAENQSHGMMTTELITFRDRRVNPLNDALRKLAKHYGGEPTKNYVWARHGIERSIYVCFRERAYELAEKEAEAAARARGEEVTDKDINDAYNAMLDELYNATSGYSRRAYLESLETECSNILSAHGDTKPFEVTDKAGLTALNDKRSLVDDKPIENAWEIVKEYENNAGTEGEADVEALFDRINDISKSMLDYSRDKGMMDKDTVEKIRKMFRFYVPLQGFAEGTMAQDYFEYMDSNPMRAGRAVPNTPKMRGRTGESADPIATLVRNAEMTIAAARRNTVATHLYNLATSRDTDLFAPARAWEAYDAAEDTWVPSTPDFTGCETTKDMMDAIRLHDEQMRQQRELGLAREARRGFSNRLITAQGAPKGLKMSMRQRHEHAVPVRINGKENVIYVLSDPRIAQIVNGTDKGSVDKNNAPFFYQANKLKRIQSGLMTSYNIAFWFANGARDIQNAFLRQAIMNGGGAAARTAVQGAKGDPLGVIPWEAMRLYNKAVKGTLDESKKHERYFKEFFEHGGITGYAFADQVENIQSRVKKLLEHPKTNPRRLMFAVGELMEKAGGAFEIAPRFATYVASRDGGKSVMQSVADAKEATVNFDRRGARRSWVMRAAAAFYAFLNPGIQGMQNRLHQVRTHPGKTSVLHAIDFAMGYLWKGIAVACLAAMGRKDDEYDTQLTEYDRRNNICFPVGDDDWVKIPINMEDRVIWGLGDAVRNGMDFFPGNRYIGGEGKDEYDDNEDWMKYAGIVSAWFPIDIGSENNFIPTSLQPIYDVYINKKDFRGNSVDWRNDYNSQLPEYQRSNPYVTGDTWMKASKWWSEVNGGDEVTRAQNRALHGWDEINPQHMQYMFQSYLGGLGTTVGQLMSLVETIGKTDDDVKWNSFKFPIANRFWKGNLNEYTATKDVRNKARIWTNWANEISRRDREYRKRGAGREGSDNTLSKEAMENYEENLKYLELAKEIEKLARKKSQAKTKATKEGRTLTDEENKEFDNAFWEQIPDFEQKYLDIDGKRKVPEWRKHYDDD